MLNVRYILLPPTDQLPAGFSERFTAAGVSIYEYTGALGPAWLVGEIVRSRSEEEILNAVVAGFDASRVAITPEEIAPVDRAAASAGRVSLLGRDEHTLRWRVEAPGPVLLVTSEIWYPAGWRAEVGGEPVPIHRVDHLLRAVRVDPSQSGGSCEVLMTFAPRSVSGGRFLSIVALVVLGGLIAGGSVSRFRSRSGSGQQQTESAVPEAGDGGEEESGR
jgi:hypothetical protein